MRSIASFDNLETLEASFSEWAATHLNGEEWKRHAGNVVRPIPKEPMNWRPHLIEVTDALCWAKDVQPDFEDFEIQAMALASASNKIAVAEGICHRFIRANKALKRLAESADRKSSVMQSLIKV